MKPAARQGQNHILIAYVTHAIKMTWYSHEQFPYPHICWLHPNEFTLNKVITKSSITGPLLSFPWNSYSNQNSMGLSSFFPMKIEKCSPLETFHHILFSCFVNKKTVVWQVKSPAFVPRAFQFHSHIFALTPLHALEGHLLWRGVGSGFGNSKPTAPNHATLYPCTDNVKLTRTKVY